MVDKSNRKCWLKVAECSWDLLKLKQFGRAYEGVRSARHPVYRAKIVLLTTHMFQKLVARTGRELPEIAWPCAYISTIAETRGPVPLFHPAMFQSPGFLRPRQLRLHARSRAWTLKPVFRQLRASSIVFISSPIYSAIARSFASGKPVRYYVRRTLQCSLPRRTAERRDILHAQRGQDHHWTTAQALHHNQAARRSWMETAKPRNHHTDGPEPDHALTFTSGHSVGADQQDNVVS